MNVSFYIAKRYLFSKKSLNAINFISGISTLGVFVGSAALVIILSVFNGFENLVISMYNTFTPEIRIEPAKGKTFYPQEDYFASLKTDKRISGYVEVLQENALITYGEAQYIGLVKGVSSDFTKGKRLDSIITDGSFTLKRNSQSLAVIGSAVQTSLSVNVDDEFTDLKIYYPKKNMDNSMLAADPFVQRIIHPSGVFELQQQFDQIIVVPIDFARDLMEEDKQVSAIELSVKTGVPISRIQQEISRNLGERFVVKNRVQQNQLLYKILNTEKSAVFLILTFVLIIAIFNIIGSLTMLVIDKKKDIAVLSSMGANHTLIRKIFFTEGIMIAMSGCITGILAGLLFCILQQHYGFIKMEGNFITDAYPIILKWTDFLLIFFTVSVISTIVSSIASRLSIKNAIDLKTNL